MPNKRSFKKAIDAVSNSMVEEMFITVANVDGVDKDLVFKAAETVIGAMGAARCRSNRFFGKGMKDFADHKAYAVAKAAFFKANFKEAIDDFNKSVSAALQDFNKALPEEVKAHNKAAAAGK